MKAPATHQSITDRLSALADLVRLRILRLLEAEELSVGEVASVVQLPQSTVSRHLKVLAEAGWITKRPEGTATIYAFVHDDLPEAARALWRASRLQLADETDLAADKRRLDAVLAQRRLDSRAFFGRVGGEWDEIRANLFGHAFTRAGLLHLIPQSWTVADLGCGTGNAAEHLAPCVSRVIAVDQSDTMLDAARKRLGAFKNIEFLQSSLEHLDIPDATVHAAVSILVLHHLPEPALAIRELARILRPGGVALVIDMIRHDRVEYRTRMGHLHLGFDPADFATLLTDAGLAEPTTHFLTMAPDARGPGLFVARAVKPS